MAHVTLFNIPAEALIPDTLPVVGGDNEPALVFANNAWVWAFDDTVEEAVMTSRYKMPGQFAGGNLKATPFGYLASETTVADGTVFDVRVEAISPADETDMTSEDFDAANTVEVPSRTTAGWPTEGEIALANKGVTGDVVAGDIVRFLIRRDAEGGGDDAAGDFYLSGIEIWEST